MLANDSPTFGRNELEKLEGDLAPWCHEDQGDGGVFPLEGD
jgi:hypothetical protein